MIDRLAERLTLPGSPFELTSADSGAGVLRSFRHCPHSLCDVYRKGAKAADAPCMKIQGRDVSYGEILNEAGSLAAALVSTFGVREGARVGVIASLTAQGFAALIATTSIGAVAVLIDPTSPLPTIMSSLDLADCELVVTESAVADALEDLRTHRPLCLIRASADSTPPYFDLPTRALGHSIDAGREVHPDQEALIVFTSGSTGTPKGVVSTHRAVLHGLMNMSLASALAASRNKFASAAAATRTSPCSLLMSPLAHVSGYSHLLLMMQIAGKVIPISTWNSEEALTVIAREKVTSLSGANTEAAADLLRHDLTAHDLRSLSSLAIHGSALRSNLIAQLREKLPGVRPSTGYGLSETNGSVSIALGADFLERPHSSGPIVPSVDIRILDESGEAVERGHVGEIWLRGQMLMSGYCAAPRASARALQGGWFRTDDFGYLDSGNYLHISERRQDLLEWHGQRISCARIEQALCDSNAVDDAVALLVPDGTGGSRLLLAAVPARTSDDPATLIAAALRKSTSLDPQAVRLVTLDRLPRTSAGKVDRRFLRTTYGAT